MLSESDLFSSTLLADHRDVSIRARATLVAIPLQFVFKKTPIHSNHPTLTLSMTVVTGA